VFGSDPFPVQNNPVTIGLLVPDNSGKTALLSSEQYDTRHAVKSLTEYAASKGGTSPLILNVNPDKTNNKLIIEKLIKEKTDDLGNRIGDIQFVQVLNNKIVLLNNK
jgi:hypothetical protein